MIVQKGENKAMMIKEMKGYCNQIGRGGTCGFGTSRIINLRDKTAFIKSIHKHEDPKNTHMLESNLSIAKL